MGLEVVLFHKPYGVLSQFTDPEGRHKTLSDYLSLPKMRPAGRLDHDSEGLLVLTDSGLLQARIADPQHKLPKTYWIQVEGAPEEAALEALRGGVMLRDGPTRPCEIRRLPQDFCAWPRDPPIRYRATIPTTWLAITLREGRNRQVRRMTAAVGHPTLRLIRAEVGPFHLGALRPGDFSRVEVPQILWSKEKRRVPQGSKPRVRL